MCYALDRGKEHKRKAGKMKTQAQEIRGRRASKQGQDLRALIEVIKGFEAKSRYYWINALVKQGEIDSTTAGRLIVAVNV